MRRGIQIGTILTSGMLVFVFVLASVLNAQANRPAAAARSASGAGLPASLERGKEVYLAQCMACHQVDGKGIPGLNPPLTRSPWVSGDKATVVRILLKGMNGVKINGVTYGNVMTPKGDLSDQQIADVLTYVRNNFENKAPPVTASDVKAIRAKTK